MRRRYGFDYLVLRTSGIARRARRAWHRNFIRGLGEVYRGTVYDVGAHFGSYSRLALDRGAYVIAVEPAPFCVPALIRLEAEYPGRFVHVAAAVGSTPSRRVLHMPRPMSGEPAGRSTSSSLDSSFVHSHNKSDPDYYQDQIEVDVVTLDGLFERFGPPSIVKVDVEGYELEVLKGLSRRVPMLQFEVTAHRPELASPLLDRCVQLGFHRFIPLAGRTQQRIRFRALLPADALRVISAYLSSEGGWVDIIAI